MNQAEFVVIGAGPAGLAAAYRLASRGFSAVVLERSERAGGLAASFEVAGQRVDHGSHRLHAAASPAVLDFLGSRLGAGLQRRRRNSRIRMQGRWLPFPLHPSGVLRSLPPGFLMRAGMSAAAAAFRPRRRAGFAEYVSTGLGKTMGEAFYFPYARKIWGIDPARLSGGQARRRIGADTPWKLVRRVAARRNGAGRFFYYPAGGFGRIPEALAEAAVEAGAELRLGAAVERIRFTDSSVEVETAGGGRVSAGRLWSTIPLTVLAGLVEETEGGPPPPLDAEYRAMLLVYLALPAARCTPFDAHYFPEADVAMTRLSEPKNYRTGPDPPDRTVLCAEIPCSPSDPLWRRPPEELGALVGESLARCGMEHPRPIQTEVRRIRYAYPIYRIGVEQALEAFIDWTDRRRRLVTFGRQGLFAHDNTHHAMDMAWAAAEAVQPDGEFDLAGWKESRRGFERHVVED